MAERTADVVIIGGGVTGASLAFQLARRGVRRVLVLERRFVGAGATGRSSALVRMHYAYFRPETGELTLVGGSVNEQDVDPDHHREGGSERLQHEVAEKLPRRLRGMERARMHRGMAGVFATSGDGHFILDRAPGIEGRVIALGCSGTGFKIAPAVGIGLGELIVHGRSETVDLRPFRATRFAEGCPIRGEHEYQDRPYELAGAPPGGSA